MTDIGVAISTTGDEHRLGFLETCVRQWCEIPDVHSLFVTVDGDAEAARRVAEAVYEHTGSVYRVGQPRWSVSPFNGRMGVAVNKNTGLELLMDADRVKHLFLCDDDTWPLNPLGVNRHVEGDLNHSMLCWGDSRLMARHQHYASWSWPRGVLLYSRREVVETAGGMDERFKGGHEHVEWSRRIHQHGLTPEPFVTPLVYAETGIMGKATRASSFWHCEDMRRRGETVAEHRLRRKQITSLSRKNRDWETAERVLVERDGDTSFVPYRSTSNGRLPATLTAHSA
jgi:hypothetical protein